MPHIIVKLYTGKTENQKNELTQSIVRDVMAATDCSEAAVSVAFEEYSPEDWPEKVYKTDIMNGAGRLYKKPGYNPFGEDLSQNEPCHPNDPPDLMAFVRKAAQQAAVEDDSGIFNPMSWLDTMLEDTPEAFDPCFDRPWQQLPDTDKAERAQAIRRVL